MTLIRYPQFRSAALVLAALLLAASPASSLIIVSDDMSASVYTTSSFNSSTVPTNPNVEDISSAFLTQLPTGGNPADRNQVQHFLEVNRDQNGEPVNQNGDVSLQSHFRNLSTSYNPGLSGTINDISFSLDILYTGPGNFGDFSRIFFSVNETSGGRFAGFTTISSDPGWQTITVTGLTQADFPTRDFTAFTDFTFGFGFTSGGDVFPADDVLTLDVDNFIVSINTVPEPAGLLALGVIAALVIRKRSL